MADKQPDFTHRNPHGNDYGAGHSPSVDANAVVDGNATDEGEGEFVLATQAQNGEEQLECHVMRGVNPSIEGSDRQVDAGKTNVNTEDDPSKVPQARTRKAVGKDKNKVVGIADRVQENIEGSEGLKGKVVPGKPNTCFRCLLANHAVADPITKIKPRKLPGTQGLKKNKAPAKFENRINEKAHDEAMTDCDEEVAENHAAAFVTNLGEHNTDSAGLAGDEESGVYTDQFPHDADNEHNDGELNTDVTGLADYKETGVYNYRVTCDSDDEHNFGEPNTDVACLADDEESEAYNDRRDSDDEHIIGELNTDVTGLAEDEEIGSYNDRISNGSGDGDNFGELNPDVAGVADDKDAGVYNDGSSSASDGELDYGELHTDAAGTVDNQGSVVYHPRDYRNSGDEHSVGDLHTDAAGAAENEDAGAYHHRDFGDSGNEDDVGEPNTDVTGVADDDDTGVYHHGAFHPSRDGNPVGELDTDHAGIPNDDDDYDVYHEAAFRNSTHEDNLDELNTYDTEVFHHGDEGNVGGLNEENRVYQQGAFRDSGDEDDIGETATATAGAIEIEDTKVYQHQAIRDASLQTELADVTGFEEDEEVKIHNNQAFHHPGDEPMGDAPDYPFDHPSRDMSSDLTSYSSGSHSPNTISKVIGCSKGHAGMEPPDQNMGEPLGVIISDVKDVTMCEAGNGAEEEAEDGQGETTQSISSHGLTGEVGASSMPTATRRNRKRKAPESDNLIANDAAATIDEKKAVGIKQVGEKARSNSDLV